MGDALYGIWDRDQAINDDLDEYFGETAQEMSERLGRLATESTPKFKNGNGHHTAAEQGDLTAAFTFLGDMPAAPPKELIKGLIPAEGIVVTGGQSSAGKTFVQVYKSVCLATGKAYFEHKNIERVGTALVAAEGRSLLPNRFGACLAKHSITEKLPITWLKQLPDFSSADGVRLLITQLKALDERYRDDFGIRLGHVVIDTVAASFGSTYKRERGYRCDHNSPH
jgi:AAA domain